MADGVTFNINDEGILEGTAGNLRFVNSAEGLRKWAPEGAAAGARLEGLEARKAYEGILTQVRDNPGAFKGETLEALPGFIRSVPADEAIVHSSLRNHVVDMVEGAHRLTPQSSAEEITAYVKNHPKGLDLRSADMLTEFKDAGHDIDALKKEGTRLAAEAERLGKLQEKLAKVKNNGQMIAFAKENAADLSKLEMTAEVRGFPIMQKLRNLARDAEPHLEELIEHKRIALHGTPAEKAEAEKAIVEVEKQLDKIYKKAGPGLENALKAHLPQDLAEEVHTVSSKYGLAANAAAESKAGTFFRWTKSESEVAALGDKAKGFMGAIWHKRGGLGKAAVIGVPLAIVGTMVASTGNKGPSQRAEAEMARRDTPQDPALAGGRA